MKVLALALLAVLTLAGCHKDDPTSLAIAKPTERTVAGGKEFTAGGVSLTFPNDWVTIDLAKGQIDQAMKDMEQGPNGRAMAQMIEAAGRSGAIKMFAFDPTHSKPGFVNNANLVVTSSGNATLDQALGTAKQQLATVGAQGSVSKVTLFSGEFGKLDSRLKMPNGTEVATAGYIKIDGGKLYVVTFTFSPDQAKTYEETARTIMQSFH